MGACVALDAVVGPQIALVDLVVGFARERLEHLHNKGPIAAAIAFVGA